MRGVSKKNRGIVQLSRAHTTKVFLPRVVVMDSRFFLQYVHKEKQNIREILSCNKTYEGYQNTICVRDGCHAVGSVFTGF